MLSDKVQFNHDDSLVLTIQTLQGSVIQGAPVNSADGTLVVYTNNDELISVPMSAVHHSNLRVSETNHG